MNPVVYNLILSAICSGIVIAAICCLALALKGIEDLWARQRERRAF